MNRQSTNPGLGGILGAVVVRIIPHEIAHACAAPNPEVHRQIRVRAGVPIVGGFSSVREIDDGAEQGRTDGRLHTVVVIVDPIVSTHSRTTALAVSGRRRDLEEVVAW